MIERRSSKRREQPPLPRPGCKPKLVDPWAAHRLQRDRRSDEFGLRPALLLSSATTALLIGALIALPRPHDEPQVPKPITVRLIEVSSPALAVVDEFPETLPAGAVAPVAEETAAASSETTAAETMAVAPPPTPAIVLPELPAHLSASAIPPVPRPAPSRSAPRMPASPRNAAAASSTSRVLAVAPLQPAWQSALPAPVQDTTSGIGVYRAGLHAQIELNLIARAEIDATELAGTAVIEAVISRDGGVISARIAHSSGNRAIDHAALAAVQRGGYRPFGAHMPEQPITIGVPITIAPG